MNSAATCREYEARHLETARATPLINVRNIALTAAAAWAQEALWAERQEGRRSDRLSAADAEIAREMQADDDFDQDLEGYRA